MESRQKEPTLTEPLFSCLAIGWTEAPHLGASNGVGAKTRQRQSDVTTKLRLPFGFRGVRIVDRKGNVRVATVQTLSWLC